MDIYLVVRTLDVNYAPLAVSTVTVSVDRGTATPLGAARDQGVFELMLPAGAATLSVHAETRGYWPVDQALTLNAGTTPTLSFDGKQEVNVRDVTSSTRGVDFNVEVFVVLGQLRDAAAKVAPIAAAMTESLTPGSQTIDHIADKALLGGGGALGRFDSVDESVTPSGTLYLVERTSTPKLIGVYRPNGLASHPTIDPQKTPLSYHMFFHPTIPPGFPTAYPFQAAYVDLLWRYMLAPLRSGPVYNPGGKHMVHQHELSDPGKNLIFIFPVGSRTEQMGTLNTQEAALRLVQEVNYWVQRMDGVAFPLQPVGKLALSCFSAGVRFLKAVFQPFGERALKDHLREMYLFDPVFAAKDRTIGEKETREFIAAVKRWWSKGQDSESFRLYTQSVKWWGPLSAASGGIPVTGPQNGAEVETVSATAVFCPANTVFNTVNPKMDYWWVHQFIPSFFMSHALEKSIL